MTIALNCPAELIRSQASFDCSTWTFRTDNAQVRVQGRVEASARDCIGLLYLDPRGHTKRCYHDGLADCELTVTYKRGATTGRIDRLAARRRAAFEILTEGHCPGVPVIV